MRAFSAVADSTGAKGPLPFSEFVDGGTVGFLIRLNQPKDQNKNSQIHLHIKHHETKKYNYQHSGSSVRVPIDGVRSASTELGLY